MYPHALGIQSNIAAITPTFSGHETFALRGNWLKKAYDVLADQPDLFAQPDAFVHLGVGKNMANAIRHWGRACGVLEKVGRTYSATDLGRWLLADDGWDPFLVTPASRWLLHWQVAAHPDSAYTWFYTFNLLQRGEFTVAQLGHLLQDHTAAHEWNVPSDTTIRRDIECMLTCYLPPSAQQLASGVEDALACPLAELGLLQKLPGQQSYRLVVGPKPDLPDALVAYAIHTMLRAADRRTIAFNDLAYAPRSPGKIFRLDEDSLLERLVRIDDVTDGHATYSDQAGIRQISWPSVTDIDSIDLLSRAFHEETV